MGWEWNRGCKFASTTLALTSKTLTFENIDILELRISVRGESGRGVSEKRNPMRKKTINQAKEAIDPHSEKSRQM